MTWLLALWIAVTLCLAIDLATRGPERRAIKRAERAAWAAQRARSVRRPMLVPHDGRWL
jgi:hypothetical protein